MKKLIHKILTFFSLRGEALIEKELLKFSTVSEKLAAGAAHLALDVREHYKQIQEHSDQAAAKEVKVAQALSVKAKIDALVS